MRRLLAFGAGAAIVGIVLLVLAFGVSYYIVSDLEKTLSANLSSGAGTATGPLEYATLEAVFLGIMAALGYGLVTKGLDGIRREEQMERGEVWTEPMFSPTVAPVTAGVQQAERVRLVKPSAPEEPPPRRSARARARPSEAPPPPPAPTMAAPAQVDQTQAREPEEAAPEEVAAEEVEAGPTGAVTEPSTPVPPRTEAEVPAEAKPTAETVTPASAFDAPLRWEGGAPEIPQGVEVLPEPEPHGAEAALAEQKSGETPLEAPEETPELTSSETPAEAELATPPAEPALPQTEPEAASLPVAAETVQEEERPKPKRTRRSKKSPI